MEQHFCFLDRRWHSELQQRIGAIGEVAPSLITSFAILVSNVKKKLITPLDVIGYLARQSASAKKINTIFLSYAGKLGMDWDLVETEDVVGIKIESIQKRPNTFPIAICKTNDGRDHACILIGERQMIDPARRSGGTTAFNTMGYKLQKLIWFCSKSDVKMTVADTIARLKKLKYDVGQSRSHLDEQLRSQIRAFKRDMKIPISGMMDNVFCNALLDKTKGKKKSG